jgi:hypothetical protein
MAKVDLIAVKRCGVNLPGKTFSQTRQQAHILVTMGKAIYATRDMAQVPKNAPLPTPDQPPVPPAPPVAPPAPPAPPVAPETPPPPPPPSVAANVKGNKKKSKNNGAQS